MSMMYLIVTLLVVFVLQTYGEDYPKNLNTYFGVDAVITCVNASENDTPNWILPSGKTIDSEKYEIYNQSLKIKSVDEEDKGIYACRIGSDETIQIYLLNMAGPLFDSIAEKYYTQFVIGGVACVIVFSMWVIVFLVYHFRYRESKENIYNLSPNQEQENTQL